MPIWNSLRHALRRRAVRQPRTELSELETMPDRLLYDIGVSRDGVPSLARLLRAR